MHVAAGTLGGIKSTFKVLGRCSAMIMKALVGRSACAFDSTAQRNILPSSAEERRRSALCDSPLGSHWTEVTFSLWPCMLEEARRASTAEEESFAADQRKSSPVNPPAATREGSRGWKRTAVRQQGASSLYFKIRNYLVHCNLLKFGGK